MEWIGLVIKEEEVGENMNPEKAGNLGTLKLFKSGLELTIRASNVKIRLSFTVSNIFKLSMLA